MVDQKSSAKTITYAFIDSQNLNLSIRALGWQLDYARFRVYLRDKYNVEKAYVFMGYVEENQELYEFLRQAGYTLIFKPILVYKDGTTKGNVDAELVMHTMIQYPHYDKALIVTGDGDFHCLVKYLLGKDKLKTVLIPNRFRFSALLKHFKPHLNYMNDLEGKLSYKPDKKRPHKDGTL